MTGHKVVIFDIDDVLMPWCERVHQECVAAGLTRQLTWARWDMWKEYNDIYPEVTKKQWLDVVNSLVVPGGMYHTPPYDGVVEAMWRVVDAGHEVHLVTARGFFAHAEQIREWTLDWVQEFKVPGTLWFDQNKGVRAEIIGATHAIDDRWDNVQDLREHGVEAYIMNQPHNRMMDDLLGMRVDSVPEFVERILSE